MNKYNTTTGEEFQFDPKEGTYAFASESITHNKTFHWNGKRYGQKAAKGLFSKEVRQVFSGRASSELSLRRLHVMSNIYRQDGDKWTCIFNPKSPAGDAFLAGQISAGELRDMIPW